MDFRGMMAQAQKMQKEMKRIQEELGNKTIEISAGGGMIKIVVTGKQEFRSIELAPEILQMNDKAMLQDLILVGVNQAIKESMELAQKEMGALTAGLGPLASLFK